MIKSSFDAAASCATIVLQPNHSWTWRANVYLILSLLVISLAVGVVLTWLGYWMILVFTTLEILILTGCLYYCVQRTHQQEVLRLSAERLVLERGARQPEQQLDIPRWIARFLVHPAGTRGRSRQVALLYGNEEVTLGSFLADQEKEQLVHVLKRTINRLDQLPAGG